MGKIPVNPDIIPIPFAEQGDKNIIPESLDTSNTPHASWEIGFPPITRVHKSDGGQPPIGKDFNGLFNQLSNNAYFAQSGGVYAWNAQLNYLKSFHVLGSDGHEYIALKPSGPDIPSDNSGNVVGAKDPVSDKSEYWFNFTKNLSTMGYEICELYYFRNPTKREGFVEAVGGVIQNAATRFPEAFQYLQTVDGKNLCITEEQWQNRSKAVIYGSQTWNSVGGVPWFVVNTATGTIRVPDVRGMYMEAAGFNSFKVGDVHADMMRKFSGTIESNYGVYRKANGVFKTSGRRETHPAWPGADNSNNSFTIDNSRAVPTGPRTLPPAFGVLACVYLGTEVNAG